MGMWVWVCDAIVKVLGTFSPPIFIVNAFLYVTNSLSNCQLIDSVNSQSTIPPNHGISNPPTSSSSSPTSSLQKSHAVTHAQTMLVTTQADIRYLSHWIRLSSCIVMHIHTCISFPRFRTLGCALVFLFLYSLPMVLGDGNGIVMLWCDFWITFPFGFVCISFWREERKGSKHKDLKESTAKSTVSIPSLVLVRILGMHPSSLPSHSRRRPEDKFFRFTATGRVSRKDEEGRDGD